MDLFHAKLAKAAKGFEDVDKVGVKKPITLFAFLASLREVNAFHAKPAKFAKGLEE